MNLKSKVIERKKRLVTDIAERVSASSVSIIADYRGLKVSEINSLRTRLFHVGGKSTVFKNASIAFAFESLNLDFPKSLLKGPSMLITSDADAVVLSKTLVDFAKEFDAVGIRGGFFDGAHVDSDSILEISKLPSRDELLAKAIMLIKSPIVGFVSGAKAPLLSVLNVLNAVKNKK
jgi:large subunit ribosomal protein L10